MQSVAKDCRLCGERGATGVGVRRSQTTHETDQDGRALSTFALDSIYKTTTL